VVRGRDWAYWWAEERIRVDWEWMGRRRGKRLRYIDFGLDGLLDCVV